MRRSQKVPLSSSCLHRSIYNVSSLSWRDRCVDQAPIRLQSADPDVRRPCWSVALTESSGGGPHFVHVGSWYLELCPSSSRSRVAARAQRRSQHPLPHPCRQPPHPRRQPRHPHPRQQRLPRVQQPLRRVRQPQHSSLPRTPHAPTSEWIRTLSGETHSTLSPVPSRRVSATRWVAMCWSRCWTDQS